MLLLCLSRASDLTQHGDGSSGHIWFYRHTDWDLPIDPCCHDHVRWYLFWALHRILTTSRSIAACRAVMRLLKFSSNDVYVHSVSINNSNPVRQSVAPFALPKSPKYVRRPEVHVTTEHITMAEFSYVRYLCDTRVSFCSLHLQYFWCYLTLWW